MAMIPGSYARAAGLQSEINKVTITRVAGSEVQFRRTIDTYQRDLRYSVNTIGRQQRQLKRSMRRYRGKLREGRKDRRQREDKEKEDEDRLQEVAKTFKDAEIAVRKAPLIPLVPPPLDEELSAEQQTGTSLSMLGEEQGQAGSPDSGIAVDSEETPSHASGEAVAGEGAKRKVFLTSNKSRIPYPNTKTKLPYLQAKRDPNSCGSGENTTIGAETGPDNHHGNNGNDKSDADDFLPSICEEGEDCGEYLNSSMNKGSRQTAAAPGQPRISGNNRDATKGRKSNDHHQRQPPLTNSRSTHHPTSSVLPLKTKTKSPHGNKQTNSEGATSQAGGGGGGGGGGVDVGGISQETAAVEGEEFKNLQSKRALSFADAAVAVMSARRRRRAAKEKAAGSISFSDLIKLQHASSTGTKRLFRLVDRLASKHGIVDTPSGGVSASHVSAFQRPKGLHADPRDDGRMRRQGKRGSRAQDTLVKQAAVFYSIKYGYDVADNDVDDDVSDDASAAHGVVMTLPLPSVLIDDADSTFFSNKRRVGSSDIEPPSGGDSETATRKLSMASSGTRKDSVEASSYNNHSDPQLDRRQSETMTTTATTSRRLSVRSSPRRGSTDLTSPSYGYRGLKKDENDTFDGAVTPSLLNTSAGQAGAAGSRSRHRQQSLSMTQLSQHATRVRRQSGLNPETEVDPNRHDRGAEDRLTSDGASLGSTLLTSRRDSRSSNRLSPLPRRQSRSLSRGRRERRDSVHNQLQQRLTSEPAESNWQSAFGRLKMLHTLEDLSRHFEKDAK